VTLKQRPRCRSKRTNTRRSRRCFEKQVKRRQKQTTKNELTADAMSEDAVCKLEAVRQRFDVESAADRLRNCGHCGLATRPNCCSANESRQGEQCCKPTIGSLLALSLLALLCSLSLSLSLAFSLLLRKTSVMRGRLNNEQLDWSQRNAPDVNGYCETSKCHED
jgi:hypothetical protein